MILECVATVACDGERGETGCPEVATCRAPLTRDTEGFFREAKRHFEKAGWRLSRGLGFNFCPGCSQGQPGRATGDG